MTNFGFFQNNNNNNKDDDGGDDALTKAEQALQRLREKLRFEEQALAEAEEALRRSREEEETLRRAEEALKRSRAQAEQRRADAIRRTEAAFEAAERTKMEQEEARHRATEAEQTLANKRKSLAAMAVTGPRPTISLDSLWGKTSDKKDEDDNDNDNNEKQSWNGNTSDPLQKAAAAIPVLYDWVQYIDGSIMGKVRGSRNFKDGSSVSTSPIKEKAVGGNIITTSSGSK